MINRLHNGIRQCRLLACELSKHTRNTAASGGRKERSQPFCVPASNAGNLFRSIETQNDAQIAGNQNVSNAERSLSRIVSTTSKNTALRNVQVTRARAQSRRGWPQTVELGRAPIICIIGTSGTQWRLIGGLPFISETNTPARSAASRADGSTRITSSRSKTFPNSLTKCRTDKRSACRATKRLTLSDGRNITNGEKSKCARLERECNQGALL